MISDFAWKKITPEYKFLSHFSNGRNNKRSEDPGLSRECSFSGKNLKFCSRSNLMIRDLTLIFFQVRFTSFVKTKANSTIEQQKHDRLLEVRKWILIFRFPSGIKTFLLIQFSQKLLIINFS